MCIRIADRFVALSMGFNGRIKRKIKISRTVDSVTLVSWEVFNTSSRGGGNSPICKMTHCCGVFSHGRFRVTAGYWGAHNWGEM